jgi:hypothetical protein
MVFVTTTLKIMKSFRKMFKLYYGFSLTRKGNLIKVRSVHKAACDERFTHAFTACERVFKEITLVGSHQGNYFEYATACSKRILKTTVATQL